MDTSANQTTHAAATQNIPEGMKLHSWYCPALSAYRWPDEILPTYWQHLLTQFAWVPLYSTEATPAPEGWVLRSYYCTPEKCFYVSHRTMSEKTVKQGQIVELFAPPGADGNEDAGHVPPQKKLGQSSKA
jgi:hypothetical protein